MKTSSVIRAIGSAVTVAGTVVAMVATAPAIAEAANHASAHPAVAHPVVAHPAMPPRVTAAPHAAPGTSRLPAMHGSPQAFAKALAKERRTHEANAVRPAVKVPAATFTVNTTADYDLASATSTHCVDSEATAHCSLRAAVDAANNLKKPVKIVLGKHAYKLTLAEYLLVTNPGGTDIVGAGASHTKIEGDGSGVIDVSSVSGKSAGLLFLSDAEITDGDAYDGGGLYLDDPSSSGAPSAVLTDDVITNNGATNEGGGIYAADANTMYMKNVTVSGNTAPEGGGMYAYFLDAHFVGSHFTGNSATTDGEGGGVWMEYGTFDMKGGSISDNTAGTPTVSGDGGAIFGYDYSDIELDGVTVDGNSAGSAGAESGAGGAFFLEFAMLDITAGSMSHNSVYDGGDGGAIYAVYGAQIGLHHLTMKDNVVHGTSAAGDGGGAIYEYAYEYPTALDMNNSSLTGSNASAIYVYGYYGNADTTITDSTLSGNHDKADNGYYTGYGCGGAICDLAEEYSGTNLAMSHDKVTDNSSAGVYSGGAVNVVGYYYGGASVSLTHSTFAHNSTGADGYGGAVGLFDDAEYAPISLQSASNHFTDNKAGTSTTPGYGGALTAYYYVTISDSGSVFSGNKAEGKSAEGGAAAFFTYMSVRLDGTRILNNSAGPSTNEGYGGAIYSEVYNGSRYNRVTISGNTAGAEGGAIFGDDEETYITNSTISGNSAGSSAANGYGGGIYVDEVLQLSETTIANNRVVSSSSKPGYGGGLYADDAHIDARYTTISGNRAKDGGGIYTDGDGGTLLSTIVSDNHNADGKGENDCMNDDAATMLNSLGANVLGQSKCVVTPGAHDVITTKAGLRKLHNYGGGIPTMALTSKSPAKGRGTQFCDSTDERGQSRPSNHCDAGAYQRAPASVSHVKGSGHAGGHVTITGSGFRFASAVHFGSHKAKFRVVSNTKIVATVPAGGGTVSVWVTSPDGTGKKGHYSY
ncbi:MAG TPA: choice-of-anchor Q domain-containing protein [Mycobacteriales bacterium]|nr:choice-of-anchor Q domain-containing protein [Mycobacteriales bacterium]